MKTRMFMLMLGGVMLPLLSWAASAQVGMVLAVKGEVQHATGDFPDKKQAAKALMLVQEGDHFFLPADGALRVVFHASGRKESWSGALLHLKAGKEGNTVVEGQGEPQVEALPPGVAGAVVQTPTWMASATRKTGGLVVRSLERTDKPCKPPADEALAEAAKQEIEAARKLRAEMDKADPADPTPDLYLFGIYAKHGQYSQMRRVLDGMKARPGAESLTGQLQTQMARLCK